MKTMLCLVIGLAYSSIALSGVIAFLDEGINEQKSWDARQNTVDPRCRSHATQILRESSGAVSVEALSLCANGDSIDYLSPNATTYRNNKTLSTTNVFGDVVEFNIPLKRTGDVDFLRHGNFVSDAAWSFDNTLFHIPFQVFYLDRTNGQNAYRTAYRSPRFPSENERAGKHIVDALDHLAFNVANGVNNFVNDLGAVSISIVLRGGSGLDSANQLCSDKVGQTPINTLYQNGIAVIAALDNIDHPSNVVTWPACLDNVIKVGSESAHNSSNPNGVGIGGMGIDYFAESTINGENGNSFAAPRIAAAFARLHKEFPYSTVQEKTTILNSANTRTSFYNRSDIGGGTTPFVRRYVKKTDMPNAIQLMGLLYLPNATGEEVIAANEVGFNDSTEHGPLYGKTESLYTFAIKFDSLRPVFQSRLSEGSVAFANAAGPQISSRRDIVLKFTGSIASSSDQSFNLYVNGIQIEQISGFSQSQEIVRSHVIHRRHFTEGRNTITLSPTSFTFNWGIKDISAEFTPVIPLELGAKDTGQYGFDENPTRYTGVRASFRPKNLNSDYVVSMVGFDIDTTDETRVFVNGTFLGYLSRSAGNNQCSAKDTFTISKELVYSGINYIELVQRETGAGWTGYQDEKWAVKDIQIKSKTPIMAPIIMLLLDE